MRLQGRTVLTGTCSPITKLWCIEPSLSIPPPIKTHYTYTIQNLAARSPDFRTTPYTTISNRVAFLHGALGNPALSTLCKALDADHLTSWLEIPSTLIRKYYPANRLRWYRDTSTKCAETLGQRKILHQLPAHLQQLQHPQQPSIVTPCSHIHHRQSAAATSPYL